MERTPWVKNPCRECGERHAGCHGECEAYKAFAEFVRLRKQGIKEYREATEPTHSFKKKIEKNWGRKKR